jgi:hypothetical protein
MARRSRSVCRASRGNQLKYRPDQGEGRGLAEHPPDHLGPAAYLDEDPLEGGVTDVVDGDTFQASRGVETTFGRSGSAYAELLRLKGGRCRKSRES